MAYILTELSSGLHPQKQVDLSANDSFYATENSAYPWYAPAAIQGGQHPDMVTRGPVDQVMSDLSYFQNKLEKSLAIPEEYLNDDAGVLTISAASWSGDFVVSSGSLQYDELKDLRMQLSAARAEIQTLRADMDMWAEEVRPAVDAYWSTGLKSIDIEIHVTPNPLTAYERAMKVL